MEVTLSKLFLPPIWKASTLKAMNVHYENTPIQIYWKFYHPKTKMFNKKYDIFILLLKL